MSRVKDENYYQISGWMINRLNLKGNALLVYALIYGFCQDEESEFSGSLSYICEWLSTSKPTVIKILSELEKNDLIVKNQVKTNGVTFNKFKVNFEKIRGSKEILPPVNKITEGSKEILQGSKKTLLGGSKETLPNNNTLDNNINNNINNYICTFDDLKKEFEKLWSIYPQKKGKKKAFEYYQKVRTRKIDPVTYETVEQGIIAFNDYNKKTNKALQFIPHGSTWFNGECWNDDYTVDETNNNQSNKKSYAREERKLPEWYTESKREEQEKKEQQKAYEEQEEATRKAYEHYKKWNNTDGMNKKAEEYKALTGKNIEDVFKEEEKVKAEFEQMLRGIGQ